MGIFKFIFNRKSIENPAKINLKNIKKFIQGTFYKTVSKIPVVKYYFVDKARTEQVLWRFEQVLIKSPECFSTGECFCGCDLEGLVYANPACEQKGHCFPEMMDVAEWELFKMENKI